MNFKWSGIAFISAVILFYQTAGLAQERFRVYPYLQNPTPHGITIRWFSETGNPGELWYRKAGSEQSFSLWSEPLQAESLDYSDWEDTTFFGGSAPPSPFLHRIRLEGLEPGALYSYRVVQEGDTFSAGFRSAPVSRESIRFIVYADSETEPESTGNFTLWIDPSDGTWRTYLVDQTTGYRQNLEVIRSREPDLVLIAGDLTQHGGEQRDWDEFWSHNAGRDGATSLAGNVPLLAALGNHEYYEGNMLDGYRQPGSERAVNRYLTYFEVPSNLSPNPAQEGRYYSMAYGPATFIVLDLCNNAPNGSEEDTNFYLLGEGEAGGGNAPGFHAGSEQYNWLIEELEAAQVRSLFTFVVFHHVPYSVGPHGFPAGEGDQLDNQSGVPVRALTPLFLEYGVDALFCGHDEILERSVVEGVERHPDGTTAPHSLHVYDLGIGGDGLRGPVDGAENPYQQFLAHTHVPEVWSDSILAEGGKHYGHLEVEILETVPFTWEAVMTPAYAFPVYNREESAYTGYERRVYPDQVVLTRTLPDTTVRVAEHPAASFILVNHPNPFTDHTLIEWHLPEGSPSHLNITDVAGSLVRRLEPGPAAGKMGSIWWDGTNDRGIRVPPGIYYCTAILPAGKGVSRGLLRVR